MCSNVCQRYRCTRRRTFIFLDYVAVVKQSLQELKIVKGVADGCVQSGSALIGGETAEMPGLYEEERV